MTNLKASLLKIIGRIRKYMTPLFMTMATLIFPVGIALLILPDKQFTGVGIFASLLGIACMITAAWSAWTDEMQKRKERQIYYSMAKSLHDDITSLITEMKKNRDERNNRDK